MQIERALAEQRYTEADSRERLQKWAARRRDWSEALGRGSALSRDEEAGPLRRAIRREDVTDQLVERITGISRDLLSVEFFELGLLAARCVGRVMTEGQPNGTGFLVAPGLMLTNAHVLPDPPTADSSDLELDFETNRVGPAKEVAIFRFRPDVLFLADRALDFALVQVEAASSIGASLDPFGFLPLIQAQGKVRIGEAVNVVQHPGGRAKQVVIRNNRLLDLPEGEGGRDLFHYEADTDKGSSGSPVFNDFWEVVALHRTAVPRTNERDELVDAQGRVLAEEDLSRAVWVANEGIRVSRIVAAFEAADLPPAMDHVRTAALQAWQVRSRPRVAENLALGGGTLRDRAGLRAEGDEEDHRAGALSPEPDVLVDLEFPIRVRFGLGRPQIVGADQWVHPDPSRGRPRPC